jgi:hypothetical protein
MPQAQTIKFNFKSRAIKDEAGNTIGRTKKQPSIEAAIPVLAPDEIVSALSTPDSAVARLIADAVARIVVDAAREQFDEVIEQFGEDSDKEVSASMLDYDRLTLDYIASIPPTQRASNALTDEDWTAFFADYLATMVAATGKAEERIKNHINLFKKPAKAKANKEVLAVLVDQLEIYMASSANLEETAVCADRISSKFKKWIAEPEVAAAVDLL